jgi:hypothetical protein
VAGPFTATTQVAGPFQVNNGSYDVAAIAKVAPAGADGSRRWFADIKGDVRALIALAVVCLGGAALTWLARRKWPCVTVVLYTGWLAAVLLPVLFSLGWMWGRPKGELHDATEALSGLYLDWWPFWIVCGIMVISQILLLAVPIRIVKERPIPQRSIWATAIAAALLFALVVTGAVASVGAMLWGDDVFAGGPVALLFVLVLWTLWAWVFRGFARSTEPRAAVRRLTTWLVRGSILELLVAVPSHILVRHKDVCCAHGLTAIGISTGLVVILMAFGPGIYFLYAERIRARLIK